MLENCKIPQDGRVWHSTGKLREQKLRKLGTEDGMSCSGGSSSNSSVLVVVVIVVVMVVVVAVVIVVY